MAAARLARIRVGVIGLGRLWEARHKPALAKLSDRFRVTAVYDQVARRAELEAASLGCDAPAGIRSLIERDDVEAVYLLSPQWFGLQPVEWAARAGKPVYCALPVAGHIRVIERLRGVMKASGIAFMPELARRYYPVSIRLRELLDTSLGRPRVIIGQARHFGFDRYAEPGPTTQTAPCPISIDPGSYLIDWCRSVFGREPVDIQGHGGMATPGAPSEPGDRDVEAFSADFGDGALAQVTVTRYHRELWGDASTFLPQPGFQVYAERGAAWVEMPDRIQWADDRGTHEERLPLGPGVGELLNDQFYRLVRGLPTAAPGWDDAIAVADLLDRLRRGTPAEAATTRKARATGPGAG